MNPDPAAEYVAVLFKLNSLEVEDVYGPFPSLAEAKTFWDAKWGDERDGRFKQLIDGYDQL